MEPNAILFIILVIILFIIGEFIIIKLINDIDSFGGFIFLNILNLAFSILLSTMIGLAIVAIGNNVKTTLVIIGTVSIVLLIKYGLWKLYQKVNK